MRDTDDALAEVHQGPDSASAGRKRRFPLKTLTAVTAGAVAVVVAVTGGTMALWVGSRTTAFPAVTAGDIGVTLGGFDLLTHTFSTTSLSKTGHYTVTNAGNVAAGFSAQISLDAGSDSTLAGGVTVTRWSAASSAECVASATIPSGAQSGTWSTIGQTPQQFELAAGATAVTCVRTSTRPSTLTSAMSVAPRLAVTTSLGGWSESATQATTQNVAASAWGTYSNSIRTDGATKYWRLEEAAGTTSVYDWIGTDDGLAATGIARGIDGAITGTKASTFTGDSTGTVSTQRAAAAPTTFAIEAWIRTTTNSGGKIVGFGSAASGLSSLYDRHLYMDASGAVTFGTWNGTANTVSYREPLNDGVWHHLVGNLSASGTELWVDGNLVAKNSTTAASDYVGYWRLGGDNMANWPGAGDTYFDGVIDDVAVYPTALSSAAVSSHWTASGRTLFRSYATRVQADRPGLYWKLADTGSTAYDVVTATSTASFHGTTTKGVQGALSSSVDTAVKFDGATGYLLGTSQYANSQNFSMELWVKADPAATTGGLLIGLSAASNYQAAATQGHIVLRDDGRLEYGMQIGSGANGQVTLATPASYRDGAWHQVVVTQSSGGAIIYVDGQQVVTRSDMVAPRGQSGYWHLGGGVTWANSAMTYFSGAIDEVAVYPQVLTAAQVADHYAGRRLS